MPLPSSTSLSSTPLLLAEKVRELDEEAAADWGLNPFALVEAAGRACALEFVRAFPRFFDRRPPAVTVLAGGGNNAADALVMLRALLLQSRADPLTALVLMTRLADSGEGEEENPLTGALRAVRKMNVPVTRWDAEKAAGLLARTDIIIDGIAGTGLKGPLRGAALEMVTAVNRPGEAPNGRAPFVVSIDVPSGSSDEWRPGLPVLAADAVLAIEPQKRCLYTPAIRTCAGRILPIGGIFPAPLAAKYRDAELLSWQSAAARIPAISADAYKYERGLVEIRAGSTGAAGAAKLAARGAQAAGAGLVRLIVDDSLYPVVAPNAFGIMVAPDGATPEGRFEPSAALLGPGWGREPDRVRLLEKYLALEERGVPLVLDADAIHLAKNLSFHGNVILTPHAGEMAAYTGLSAADILAAPGPILRRFAGEKKACILFKSHVLYAAAPDGRLGLIDGMSPALAAGGSGDVLAGLCAAIAGRWRAIAGRRAIAAGAPDWYACACAAAALLMEAARAIGGRFIDPAELADAAALIAGKAWLPADNNREPNHE
jgi:NAD(P)H-hydrate epimerase